MKGYSVNVTESCDQKQKDDKLVLNPIVTDTVTSENIQSYPAKPVKGQNWEEMENRNRGRQVPLLQRGEPQNLAKPAKAKGIATRGSKDPLQCRGNYLPGRLPYIRTTRAGIGRLPSKSYGLTSDRCG